MFGKNKKKEKPLKIIFLKEEEEFQVVEGFVDLGYLGTYDTENISINVDEYILEDVFEADEEDEYYEKIYLPLKAYLQPDMSMDEVAVGLSNFYNARIADIKKHQVEINQMFLAHILDDLCGSGFPLWEECPDYIVSSEMKKYDVDDIESAFYNEDAVDAAEKLSDQYYKSCHDGDVISEPFAENVIKTYFPLFNVEKFLNDIYGECLALDNANVTFQCSGKNQALEIACAAYAEITIQNSFSDWHNH